MSWAEKSLDELGFVSRGRSRHRPRDAAHLYGGPYPFVQTGNVKHANLYITDYTQTYSEAGLAQSKLWQAGTLCITIAANIADTAILAFDACFPDSIIGFIPHEGKADARFIKYLFDALLQRQYKTFTQGAAQDNLSQSKLLSLRFPVPDLNKQRRIADVLCACDDLIENNRRRITLLEQAARRLYKEWFVRLRFPGHEHVKIIGGIPDGWEKASVSDLGVVVTGKTPATNDERNYGDEIPFIKTPDMHASSIVVNSEGYLSEQGADSQGNKYIPPHSIMVACIGNKLGVVAMNAYRAQTNQQINSIIPFEDCYRYYSYFLLLGMKSRLEAMGGGATMPNVNKSKFESLPAIIPNRNLLMQFHAFAKPIFTLIQTLVETNKKTSEARDLLLPRLMNGELAV